MNAQKYKAWTYFRNGRPAWLTDLPGCDGTKSNGSSSDYGYGDEEQAIEINEYQWKKFAKYQADVGRCGYCIPVRLPSNSTAGEEGEIVYADSGNKVPRSEGATPMMDLPATFPQDVDYEWYEREAERMLYDIGYAVAPVDKK